MWQLGQIAETMSTSSEISPAQPVSGAGSGLAAPFWLTFLKQPLAVVQAGSPNCVRYWARSDSAFGSSCASTIATVVVVEDAGSLYALTRFAGLRPDGVALGPMASELTMSVRRRAKQLITCALAGAAQARATLGALAAWVAASAGVASRTPAVRTAAAPIATNTGGLTRIFPPMQGVAKGPARLVAGPILPPLMCFSSGKP